MSFVVTSSMLNVLNDLTALICIISSSSRQLFSLKMSDKLTVHYNKVGDFLLVETKAELKRE